MTVATTVDVLSAVERNIAALEGAKVKLVAHRGIDRVFKSAAVSKERFGVDLEPAPGETPEQKAAIIADAEVIFAAAAAGRH